MSGISEKQARLVDRLSRKTQDGGLTWELHSNGKEVMTNVGEAVIGLNTGTNQNREPIVIVKMYKDGRPVDSFTDDDLEDPNTNEHPGYFSLLTELYTVALRQARGVDGLLDDLLSNLDQ